MQMTNLLAPDLYQANNSRPAVVAAPPGPLLRGRMLVATHHLCPTPTHATTPHTTATRSHTKHRTVHGSSPSRDGAPPQVRQTSGRVLAACQAEEGEELCCVLR